MARCKVFMRHPDKSEERCVLNAGHTRMDSDHLDRHGHTAPVLVHQSSVDEAGRIGNEYPDGIHTCAELQQLEPGRCPCSCGRCPIVLAGGAG